MGNPGTHSDSVSHTHLWETTGKVSEKPLPESGVLPAKSKFKSNGYEFRLHSDGTATLSSAGYKKGKKTIPHHIKYKGWLYSVFEIDSEAFMNNSDLKSIVIPRTVILIDPKAFIDCRKLGRITLGNVEIGKNAFKGIKNKAQFYVQCEDSKYDEVKIGIKESGAKNPRIKWVEPKDKAASRLASARYVWLQSE